MSSLVHKGTKLKGFLKRAIEVFYDNTDSGLTADTVQDAVDEVAGDISALDTKIDNKILVERVRVVTDHALAGSTGESLNVSVAKSGYTCIGCVGIKKTGASNANVNLSGFYLHTDNNIYVAVKNNGTSQITFTLDVDILYLKN